MSGKTITKSILLLAICAAMGFFLTGCGGGGGSGGSSVESSSGTGSVALLLADGPADDYDHIFITITEVLLIPLEGSGREPVVIYRNPSGLTVDLLDLRDEDFLVTVRSGIAARRYEKIRLVISDIQPVGGPCSSLKLSSHKIDLNPRGHIEVVAHRTVSIRLDVDANKSINISASCNFRPVVFVDIEHGAPLRPCPRVLTGTIERFVRRDGIIVGFVLDLEKQRGELDVRVTDDTAVFDQNGEFGGRELLDGQEGERVHVRGRLDDNARLQASVVVLGRVLMVKGDVDGPVDDATDLFPFTPFRGEVLVGQHDVEVADETLVLIGCDTEVEKEAIQDGMIARVLGKLVRTDGVDVLRSVVVFLQAREISGQITSIVDEIGGKTVTVEQETGGDIEVFIPSGTPINIEGDGSVPMELFCEGRQVRIFLDPHALGPLTATFVIVQAERRVGEVTSVDEFDRTLTVDGESVFVQLGATILDTRGPVDTLVGFEEIDVNDQLEYFGLDACPGDMGFTAFVILITG
jgi:hypothetical protein